MVKWYFNNYEGNEEFELKEGKGKEKEYNDIGKLKFEGEYLNGKNVGWKIHGWF